MRLFDARTAAVGRGTLCFWSQPLWFISLLFHDLKYALSVDPRRNEPDSVQTMVAFSYLSMNL